MIRNRQVDAESCTRTHGQAGERTPQIISKGLLIDTPWGVLSGVLVSWYCLDDYPIR